LFPRPKRINSRILKSLGIPPFLRFYASENRSRLPRELLQPCFTQPGPLLPSSAEGPGFATFWPAPVTKLPLTITHRLFQSKVLQRTDCRVMCVLIISAIGGYPSPHPPVVTDRVLALALLRSLGPIAFEG
jgi:hypothetical protein